MEYKDKIEQYKVSIRRKNLNQKLAGLRAKNIEPSQTSINVQQVTRYINSIFNNSNISTLYSKVQQLKKYSQSSQTINILKQYFEGFYRLLIEVDVHFAGKSQNADRLFSDICTILINITSSQTIDFTTEIKNDLASPVYKNINNKHRQIETIWFIANILYRKNKLSKHFMKVLINNNISNYIKIRINSPFLHQSDLTLFNYFVGALVANLEFIQKFNDYKTILQSISVLAQLELDQCYLYILDGLSEHAFSFGVNNYQIFSTSILKKCDLFCKNKKTRFVVKYLEIVINFLLGQAKLLAQSDQKGRKKLASSQYQRCKKQNILKNMLFCLDNRSPEVKRLLFEASFQLIKLYFQQIYLLEEQLYLNLLQQIKSAQNFDKNGVFSLLKYLEILIISLLQGGAITHNKQYAQTLLKFIEGNRLFDKIQYFLRHYSQQLDILNVCFDILAFLQDYGIPQLKHILLKTSLLQTLDSLQLQNAQLDRKRTILISFISKQENQIAMI